MMQKELFFFPDIQMEKNYHYIHRNGILYRIFPLSILDPQSSIIQI